MHTEYDTPTRVQRYFTRHARTLAAAIWLAVSATLVPIWCIALRVVFHIVSPSLAWVSSAILVALIGIVTLALYWEHDA